MFSQSGKSVSSYEKVGLETGVNFADPHKLIAMLLDAAMLSLSKASDAIQKKQIENKGRSIAMAVDIISSGLQASIDKEAGGEIADRLDSLYNYMCTRLLFANLHNDLAAIQEVSYLLGEIKAGWSEIANDPAVSSHNKVAT